MEKKLIRITSVMMALLLTLSVLVVDVNEVQAADYSAWAAVFDATYYYNNCAEARAYAGTNVDKLWQYFTKVGIPRGDQASEEFNVFIYAKNYPDLYKMYGGNMVNYYIHYVKVGKKEGRNGKTLLSQANTTANNTSNTNVTSTNSQVSGDNEAYRSAVVDIVNQERAANGLSALSTTPELNAAAQARANEIVQSFSHTRPDGRSCFTIFDEYNVTNRRGGENIAAGQRSPESVMNSWMNSSGHRANILNGSYGHIGVGCVTAPSGYGIYWVQLFTD